MIEVFKKIWAWLNTPEPVETTPPNSMAGDVVDCAKKLNELHNMVSGIHREPDEAPDQVDDD